MRKRFHIKYLLLSIFFLIAQSPAVAYATDYRFNELNDIRYYDSSSSSSTSTCSTVLSGDDNIEKIWNFLIDKGLKDHQAAGVLGNLQAEGGFNPFRQEISVNWPTGGYGLAQWTAGRRTTLIDKIQKELPNIYSNHYDEATSRSNDYHENDYFPISVPQADNDQLLLLELNLLYDEAVVRKVNPVTGLSGMTDWQAVAQASTTEEASNIWLESFERPGDVEKTRPDRIKNSNQIFAKLSGLVTGSSSCVTNDKTALIDQVLKFVLPDYHSSTYTGADKATSDYVAAANAANFYVGNGANPYYADCGGFITILMRSSGYDTKYNSIADGGRGGPTASQYQYLKENWQDLGPAATIDTSTLQPGDVWITSGSGHTSLYIGDVPGINAKLVSASNMERVPMADPHQSLNATNGTSGDAGNAHWFRKK